MANDDPAGLQTCRPLSVPTFYLLNLWRVRQKGCGTVGVNTCGAGFVGRRLKERKRSGSLKLIGRWSNRRDFTINIVIMATAPWVRSISRHLKEVRIHLCQTSKSSQGVR